MEVIVMVVMIGSREAKEDLEARSVGRRRKEGRKKQGEVDGGCIKGGGEERGGKGGGRTIGRRGRYKR